MTTPISLSGYGFHASLNECPNRTSHLSLATDVAIPVHSEYATIALQFPAMFRVTGGVIKANRNPSFLKLPTEPVSDTEIQILKERFEKLSISTFTKFTFTLSTAPPHAGIITARYPFGSTRASSGSASTKGERDLIVPFLQDLCVMGVLWDPVTDQYVDRDSVYQAVSEINNGAKSIREASSKDSPGASAIEDIQTASKTLLQDRVMFKKRGANILNGPVDCNFRNMLCGYRRSIDAAYKALEHTYGLSRVCPIEFAFDVKDERTATMTCPESCYPLSRIGSNSGRPISATLRLCREFTLQRIGIPCSTKI